MGGKTVSDHIEIKLTRLETEGLLNMLSWVHLESPVVPKLRKALGIPEPEIHTKWENGLWESKNDDPNTCKAARDGDCFWKHCPQLRDGEPAKSHRHCPLDKGDDDEC